MWIFDFQFLCEDMDNSMVISTEAIFVYYSFPGERVCTNTRRKADIAEVRDLTRDYSKNYACDSRIMLTM